MRPYLTRHGTLVIPCDPRYHYWRGGQSILATLDEPGATRAVRLRYDADAYRDAGALSTRAQLERLVASALRRELAAV